MAGKVTLLALKFMLRLQVRKKLPDITSEAGGGLQLLRSAFSRGIDAVITRVSMADGSSRKLTES